MPEFLLVLIALVLLTGCEKREVFGERRIDMQVVSVKLASKSNSKVTLRQLGTGTLYIDQRLSCGRQRAERVRIGSQWEVTEMTYFYPESHRYTIELVGTSAICDKSQ